MFELQKVNAVNSYTCDSFEMKSTLKDDRNCITCVRHETTDCTMPLHMVCYLPVGLLKMQERNYKS